MTKGFTLIEVLIALVIVVASLTIIAQGFANGGRAVVQSDHLTTAVMLAQQKIAELESGEQPLTGGQNGVFDDTPDFRYQVDIQADTVINGLYQVTVTITWQDRGNDTNYALYRLMRERSGSSTTSGGTGSP